MRIPLRCSWTLSNHSIELKDEDWLREIDTEVKSCLLQTSSAWLTSCCTLFLKKEVWLKTTLGHAAQTSYIYNTLYIYDTGSLPKL